MPSQADRHVEIAQALKNYLEDQSRSLPEAQFCAHCGALLFQLKAQCWLEGEEQGWNIYLPCCPQCHPFALTEKKLAA
jgi:hypothetical protein